MKSMQDFATGRLIPFVCTYVSIIDLFIALGGGALPHMAYSGMCRWTGYGFWPLCPKQV